jgi:hypothetical protein
MTKTTVLLASRLEDALGNAFHELEISNPEVAGELQEIGAEVLAFLTGEAD